MEPVTDSQQNGKLTFWLNGVQTVQVDMKSDEWKKLVAASSMSHYPEFGTHFKGTYCCSGLDEWCFVQRHQDQKSLIVVNY